MFSTSQALGRLVTIALGAAVLVTACYQSDFYPVIDVALSPAVGIFRSPTFSIDSSSAYAIGIGTEGVLVDEGTCRAAAYMPGITERAEKGGSKLPPCHMLTPSVGAFTWKLTRGGRVIAQGSARGLLPNPWWGPSKSPTILPEPIAWQFYQEVCAPAGKNYVLELNLQPSPAPLEWFHPRVGIVKDWKRTSPSCASAR